MDTTTSFSKKNECSSLLFNSHPLGILFEVRYLIDRNPTRAMQRAEEMMEVTRRYGDPVISGLATVARAIAIRNLGRFQEALDLLDGALQILSPYNDEESLLVTHIERLRVLLYIGRYAEAMERYHSLYPVAKRYPLHLPWLEMNAGVIYAKLGEFRHAERHLQQAIDQFHKQKEREAAALSEANLATVYLSIDHVEEARDLFNRCAVTFVDLGMEVPLAKVDLERSYLAERAGRFDRALLLLSDSIKRFTDLGMQTEALLAHLHAAGTSLSINLIDEAIAEATTAMSGFERLGMTYNTALSKASIAKALFQISLAHKAYPLLDEARATFQTLGISHQTAEVDRDIAEYLLTEGRYSEALQHARRASLIFGREGLLAEKIRADLVIADVHRRWGATGRAKGLFLRLREEAVEKHLNSIVAKIDHALGRIAGQDSGADGPGRAMADGLREALKWYNRSIENVERLRTLLGVEDYRIAFLVDRIEAYEDATSVAIRLGETAEAFRYTEMAKSRVLLDMMDGRSERIQNYNAILEGLRLRLNTLYRRRQLSGSPPDLDQMITTLETEVTSLLRRIPGKQLRKGNDVVTLQEVQKFLIDGECLLEYSGLPDNRLALFLIRKDTCEVIDLGSHHSEIEEAIVRWRFAIEQFAFGSDFIERHRDDLFAHARACLTDLYRLLIAPVISHLDGIEHLLIAPHGQLHRVPFPALTDGHRYLSDYFYCSFLPCASILCFLPHTNSESQDGIHPYGKALVVGVPDQRTPAIPEEVRSVADYLHSDILFDGEATIEAIRQRVENYNLLHIACHGLFRTDNPSFSALLLSDGRWTAREIAETDMTRTSLVVLSSCYSGVSHVGGGDELIGLIRAFLAAGAGSLVASQWQAEDRVTADLMISFYRHMLTCRHPAKALNLAQGELRQWYPHPYYWASFFVVGR